MKKPAVLRHLPGILALAAAFLVGYRWPTAGGWGLHEITGALALPLLLFWSAARGLGPVWLWLSLGAAITGMFNWLPQTLLIRGGVPLGVGILGLALQSLWEALGPFLALLLARRLKASGNLVSAFAAAGMVMAWERFGYHVYPVNWAAPFGALPLFARSGAFLGGLGLLGLTWGVGTWVGLRLGEGLRGRATWLPAVALPAVLALLGLGWHLLPKGPQRVLDVVIAQPNFTPGERRPGMEEACWALTDPLLSSAKLPRPDAATLVAWPESSQLGRDDRFPDPRLAGEAQRRGVAWLFGTEGGLLNLVRGEVAGQPPFVQGKVVPMPFGERMPGPEPMRRWLDAQMGFYSQVPDALTERSSFTMPTPQGPLRVHPIICSDALIAPRVLDGVALAGGDLLTNHTNDGWFSDSDATDLHAAQIRLRAVETGLPMVRATLTGKSGLFFADGTWELWSGPMAQDAFYRRLTWQPVNVPFRHPGYRWGLLVLTLLGAGMAWWRRPRPAAGVKS